MEKVRWSIAAKGAVGLRRDRTSQPYKPKVQPDIAIKGPLRRTLKARSSRAYKAKVQ